MTVPGGQMPCSGRISLADVNPLRAPPQAGTHKINLNNPHARWIAGGAHVPPLSKISMHDLYCKPPIYCTQPTGVTAIHFVNQGTPVSKYFPLHHGEHVTNATVSPRWLTGTVPGVNLWAGVTGVGASKRIKFSPSMAAGMPAGTHRAEVVVDIHDPQGNYGRLYLLIDFSR